MVDAAKTKEASKYPVLNDTYELLCELGSGKTSKVYLARLMANKE